MLMLKYLKEGFNIFSKYDSYKPLHYIKRFENEKVKNVENELLHDIDQFVNFINKKNEEFAKTYKIIMNKVTKIKSLEESMHNNDGAKELEGKDLKGKELAAKESQENNNCNCNKLKIKLYKKLIEELKAVCNDIYSQYDLLLENISYSIRLLYYNSNGKKLLKLSKTISNKIKVLLLSFNEEKILHILDVIDSGKQDIDFIDISMEDDVVGNVLVFLNFIRKNNLLVKSLSEYGLKLSLKFIKIDDANKNLLYDEKFNDIHDNIKTIIKLINETDCIRGNAEDCYRDFLNSKVFYTPFALDGMFTKKEKIIDFSYFKKTFFDIYLGMKSKEFQQNYAKRAEIIKIFREAKISAHLVKCIAKDFGIDLQIINKIIKNLNLSFCNESVDYFPDYYTSNEFTCKTLNAVVHSQRFLPFHFQISLYNEKVKEDLKKIKRVIAIVNEKKHDVPKIYYTIPDKDVALIDSEYYDDILFRKERLEYCETLKNIHSTLKATYYNGRNNFKKNKYKLPQEIQPCEKQNILLFSKSCGYKVGKQAEDIFFLTKQLNKGFGKCTIM